MPENRVGRSPVILDVEDIRILLILKNNRPEMLLRDLESQLKISRKSILVHIDRLFKFHWINYFRSKEDYKFKKIGISSLGFALLEALKNSGVYVISGNKLFINKSMEEIFKIMKNETKEKT